ncbi:fibronectin type III-like domain-contianing protein [Streptomyces sp. NPDC056227]|uniref:fibronectin type III-like domain-contianing protein n=1 Tax=Streptomyces sp. NPDC056227 TaxID=3345753 RepID=UPI0035E26748
MPALDASGTWSGARPGRDVVLLYVSPPTDSPAARPERWPAGFASVTAGPDASAEAEIALPERAFQV